VKRIRNSIKYDWHIEDDAEIIPEHIHYLDEHAFEHVFGMIKEGYRSGELVQEYTTENGKHCSYRGWWEIDFGYK
jgi:hypothetical protein